MTTAPPTSPIRYRQTKPNGMSARENSPLAFFCGLAYGVGAVLLLTVIVVAAQGLVDPRFVSELFVAATLAVLLGAIISRRAGGLTLIVFYFFAMFMALPAAVQIRRNSYPFGGSYDAEELNAGFLVVALGMLCFLVGMGLVSARSRPSINRGLTTESIPRQVTSRRAVQLAMRMSLVFTAIAAGLGAMVGPGLLFTARGDEAEGSSGAVQLLLVARSLALVALLLWVIAIRRSDQRRTHKGIWLGLVLVAGVAFVLNFPAALPRFQLLGIVLAVVVLLADFHRPLVKSLFTGVATFFLLYLFAPVKDLRSGALAQSFTPNAISQWDPGEYLLTVDFDGFKQTVDTLIYYSEASLRFGANFLGVLLFWVPRSLWPGKPVHTGQIVSEGLGYWYNNVSSPLPAEAFASWGIVGVMGVFLLLGAVVTRIERSSRESGILSVPQLIIYALAVGYSTILLRGALNAVAPMICSAFVLAFVVWLVYRRDGAISEARPDATDPVAVARPKPSREHRARTYA